MSDNTSKGDAILADAKPVAGKPAALTQSLQTQGYATTRWVLNSPAGVTFERIIEPSYWAHLAGAGKIRPCDIIEVHPETHDFWAELIVRSVGRVEVNVFPLRHVKFDEVEMTIGSPITVSWRGPVNKYALMRGDAMVAKGFSTKEEAYRAVSAYDKEFAA